MGHLVVIRCLLERLQLGGRHWGLEELREEGATAQLPDVTDILENIRIDFDTNIHIPYQGGFHTRTGSYMGKTFCFIIS